MKCKVVRATTFAVAVVGAWTVLAAGPWASPKKKIIAAGWEFGSVVTPEQMLEHADLLDKTGLDGFVVGLPYVKCPDGKHHKLGWETMTGDFITEEVLGRYVPIYKELTSRHKSFSDAFLACNWCPISGGRFRWNDDAAWAKFAANMKVIASVARRGGFVGLVTDGEDYGGKKQFFRMADEAPFDVTGPLARERGRQIGRAMFGEVPNMKMLSFWFLSLEQSYARSTDAAAAMRGRGDLWPMFINGILDVMPPEVEFIDGNEHAYGYKSGRRDFEASNVRQLTRALALVAPENRAKYRAQMRVGFGLFLDPYARKVDGWSPNAGSDGTPLGGFRECLEEAVYASDEYVWLWCAKQRWIKWREFKPPLSFMKIGEETWEEKLPGLTKTILETKAPKAEIDARLAEFRAAGAKNLVAPALARKSSNWQGKESHGTFSTTPGKGSDGGPLLAAEGVSSGCFVLDVTGVKQGDVYYAEAYVRGKGVDCMWVRWRKDGKWAFAVECVDEAFGEPDADGWRRVVARTPPAPEGMTGVTLKIDVRQSPGDRVELDRVVVFKK